MKTLLALALVVAALPAFAKEKGEGDGPCRADVQKFCKDVTPGGGRIVACLKAYEDKLSEACKAKGAQAKEAGKEMEAACAQDRESLCKDVKPGDGRILKCLHERKDKLSQGCSAFLARKGAEWKEKHPKAAEAMEACRADKDKFCKDVQPGEGRVVDCMKSHESDLSSSCRETMKDKGRHEEKESKKQ